MEVMRANFPSLRVAATIIKSRANSPLYRLDYFLIFHFDAMQTRADTALAQ